MRIPGTTFSDLPLPGIRSIEFMGTPSGDYECFCWDVTREEYITVTGRKPCKADASINFATGKNKRGFFRLYPNDVLAALGCEGTDKNTRRFIIGVGGRDR